MVKQHCHIAVPYLETIRPELSAIINAILLKHRCGFNISIRYCGGDRAGQPISSNRNRIMRDAPEDTDYVLMLDTDVVPPLNVLEIAKYDCDIVACPSPIWRPGEAGGPVITNVVPLDETEIVAVGEDKLLECYRVGGGAYCVAKRVYTHPEMRGAFGNEFDEDGVTVVTDDYVYCDKARALGFKVFAALKFPLGHIKSIDLVNVHDVVNRARA